MSSEEIASLKETLNSLRNKILSIRKMCEDTNFQQDEAHLLLNEGLLDLIEIKKLNESIQLNSEKCKEDCNQNKINVGKENLNLQKQQYHLDLINNEIYSNKHLPKSLQIEKVIKDEMLDNDIKLEKFNEILLGRKRLNTQLNELIKEKDKNKAELKSKENSVKDIPKYIEAIENNASKAKNLFIENK